MFDLTKRCSGNNILSSGSIGRVNETPKPENTLPQTLHEAITFFAAGDAGRFLTASFGIFGKRLPYARLTGKMQTI